MLFKTHIIFAIFLSLIFVNLIHPSNQILFVIIVAMASLIPDMDHKNSKLGRWIIISRFLKHRGFLHTIWGAILFSLILMFFIPAIYVIAFFIGYLSHLVMDMLTRQGIALFYPFFKFRITGFIKTGKLTEKIIFVMLVLLDIVLLVRL